MEFRRESESVHDCYEKIRLFTNWSSVFLVAAISWLTIAQNKQADGYAAVSYPIIIAIGVMVHYERRIRLLAKHDTTM